MAPYPSMEVNFLFYGSLASSSPLITLALTNVSTSSKLPKPSSRSIRRTLAKLSSYSEIKVEKVWSSPLNSKIPMINLGICCSTTSIVMRQGSNSSHVSFKELGKMSVSLIVWTHWLQKAEVVFDPIIYFKISYILMTMLGTLAISPFISDIISIGLNFSDNLASIGFDSSTAYWGCWACYSCCC